VLRSLSDICFHLSLIRGRIALKCLRSRKLLLPGGSTFVSEYALTVFIFRC
jgi:hypothetical protein